MSRIWTIARREIKSLFDQPTGYVLLVVFLAINAFMFFRTAYLSNTASLRPMLDFMPWVFLFFVPAVAMRALAEDNRGGLLEIVLAQPVSEAELVIGKYLGVLLVIVGALGTTLLIPIGLDLGSDLQWGPVVAQYLGAVLLAAGFSGVGLWASSLSKSQITAFILSVAVMFVLILVGLDPLLVGLPPVLGTVASRLGVLSHFESIGRGVLDLRDLLYFLSLAAVFLVLAYAVVMRRRLPAAGQATRRLRLGSALLVAILVAVNLAGGQIGGRIDLTPGNAYTLSGAAKEIARSLDDIVTLKLFSSRELPAEFALTRRDVDDLLRDLRSASGGKLRVVERDPAEDQTAAEDARNLGIVPVQFNVVGEGELKVKEGFFGLVIQYADRHEVIPFVQRTDDLEYRVVSAIRNLTRGSKPKIAMLTDPAAGSFGVLRGELEKSYLVETPSLSDSTPLGTEYAAVIIASARDSIPASETAKVRSYLQQGGTALILESGMAMSPQGPFASARPVAWNPVLADFGVRINQDMVYDLRANQVVGVPSNFGRLLRQYPYFVRGQSTRSSIVNAELGEVGMAWASSVAIDSAAASRVVPLIETTEAAGVSTGMVMVDPNQDFPSGQLARRTLAVQVMPEEGKDGARLVVVGSALFGTDEMARRGPESVLFALNAVDWLAQDEALIAIRAKDRRPPALVFESEGLRDAVKYLNVVGLPLLIAGLGLVRLVRRKQRSSRPYARLAGGEA